MTRLVSSIYNRESRRKAKGPNGPRMPRKEDRPPPRAASLAQRRYADSLAIKLGYTDARAFLESWAGKDERGMVKWNARIAHLAIDEMKRRLSSTTKAHELTSPKTKRDSHTKRSADRSA